MFLLLHQLCIHLRSQHPTILAQWETLFSGWLLTGDATSGDATSGDATSPETRPVDLRLELELVDKLPPLPTTPLLFSDTHHLPDNVGILSVYTGTAGHVWLHYLDGGLVDVPLERASDDTPLVARGVVTQEALDYGRFEDITFTSLAPLLRQRGYFLVHAFAARHKDRCVLIVGPSGSGKTTSGLALLLNGWQLLSNDILLLKERNRVIYALPTPGLVRIRPPTLKLLPTLAEYAPPTAHPAEPWLIPANHFILRQAGDAASQEPGRWPDATPITTILFPHIERQPHSFLHPQNRAICLARLMAESMDRWDEHTLSDHLNVLQLLTRQAQAYNLHVGQLLQQLPALLSQA